MKISTILDHIDSGYMALPKFQRGYVWNRDQVRRLMDSLYRRHPVGSLLVWVTESEGAPHRGDSPLPPGQVKLLLDGQQRMTTMYGIIRGKPPEFFDGNAKSFTGLHFNLATEEFSFYMARKMEGDPLWVDVTRLMDTGLGPFIQELSTDPQHVPNVTDYINRLNTLHSIRDIEFHAEEVTGQEKNVEVVVDIFNRINSGGTKLSQGDLALAKICAGWPEARDEMKEILATWKDADYKFDLDWLLRNVNTVLTGEARFVAMHHVEPAEVQEGLRRAQRACDLLLNLVSDRLGLDHNRVLFGRYAFPVMAHYVDRRGGRLDDREEQDRLLYWYLQNAMWGRFSASTESTINQDLHQLENMDGGLDRLLDELRLWRGDLRVKPGHFVGWSIGARFYPVLYLLTRVGEARDWGSGVALKRDMLGRGSSLHVHHIFPKARLYKVGRRKSEVNALANYAFQTQDTNLAIGAKLPEVYFEEIASKFPGALESQWIPMDRELWKTENYLDFLDARRELLAAATNRFLDELAHAAAAEATEEPAPPPIDVAAMEIPSEPALVPGSIDSEEEQEMLLECNVRVVDQGLPEGEMQYEVVDDSSGRQLAIFDLAWPRGLQPGLSQPVAVLIDEGPETHAVAGAMGFRFFTSVDEFREYVAREVLAVVNP